MKKIFILPIVFFFFNIVSVRAQWSIYNGFNNFTQNAGVTLTNESYQNSIGISVSSCNGCYGPYVNAGDAVIRSTGGGSLVLHTNSTNAGRGICFGEYKQVEITDGGKLRIGSVSTDSWDYRLFVEAGILTEKLKVAVRTSGAWADYVFDKKYKLMPLSDVEKFITKNKHLPNVPSADEVVKDGIDMATMDAKLLEKIEELTLYVIKLNKEVEELKRLNKSSAK
jgi:hypothetical protein